MKDKRTKCGECGQEVEPNQFHSFECCVSFKVGIKTVVEFIRAERKCRYIDDVLYYPVYEKALETKEKEWGL